MRLWQRLAMVDSLLARDLGFFCSGEEQQCAWKSGEGRGLEAQG